jgi:hypothetical protein
MSKVTKFLGSVVGGIFGSEGDMKDYKHAARLFTDDYMRLAPKVEFLYHVHFDINKAAARSPGGPVGWSKSEPNIEVGMLVKACQVPGVTLNTETKNQYGKKTNIQTQVQYTPINITFHDDNVNLISGMWQQYFKNYYADSVFPEELKVQPTYSRPGGADAQGDDPTGNTSGAGPYRTSPIQSQKVGFGINSDFPGHFFNKISIYQLSRHNFFEYTLINPIIQSWQGPQLNSSSSQPAENQMVLIYEGIKYAQGRVGNDNPDGFAQLHYDKSPSPLSIMGGGSSTLFGQNGVVAGGLDVFGDLLDPNVTSNPLALLGTAIKAKNTIDNAKQLTKAGIKNEVSSIATGAITNTIEDSVQIFGLNKVNDTKATQVALTKQDGEEEVADTTTIQKSVNAGNNTGEGTTTTGGKIVDPIDPNTGRKTEFLNTTDYYAWINSGKPAEWEPGGGAEQLIITVIPLEN